MNLEEQLESELNIDSYHIDNKNVIPVFIENNWNILDIIENKYGLKYKKIDKSFVEISNFPGLKINNFIKDSSLLLSKIILLSYISDTDNSTIFLPIASVNSEDLKLLNKIYCHILLKQSRFGILKKNFRTKEEDININIGFGPFKYLEPKFLKDFSYSDDKYTQILAPLKFQRIQVIDYIKSEKKIQKKQVESNSYESLNKKLQDKLFKTEEKHSIKVGQEFKVSWNDYKKLVNQNIQNKDNFNLILPLIELYDSGAIEFIHLDGNNFIITKGRGKNYKRKTKTHSLLEFKDITINKDTFELWIKNSPAININLKNSKDKDAIALLIFIIENNNRLSENATDASVTNAVKLRARNFDKDSRKTVIKSYKRFVIDTASAARKILKDNKSNYTFSKKEDVNFGKLKIIHDTNNIYE